MKRKKILSILLASAMIGTAPASAWAADFTDTNVVDAEEVTEEATEEDVPEQQEDDAESIDLEADDAEDLSQDEDAAAVSTQESEDPFSAGEAVAAFADGEESGDLTLAGTGTEADPYLVTSTADIQAVADYVNNGKGTFANQYLKFTEDITLPEGWTPIGIKTSKFQGNLDGDNHLLTVPKGEKCLLGYVADSTLKNLNIYGEQIASDGVVCNYEVDHSSRNPIKIDNVTLKAGTQTLKSGFIGGYASGQNQITITNSTVEKGVVIGYDKAQSNIGSFGGDFNGTIENCVSYADVYGTKYVGGILGSETGMVQCWDNGIQYIQNNSFEGTVSATNGTRVGGVIGYIKGIDKYNIIENNEYTCKDVKGIGAIDFVDTNYANPTPVEGVTYYNSENGRPSISGATKAQHNRTDDPLGADADKLTKLVVPKIKVSLTILGDQVHDSDKDHQYHTYYAGNLETWLEQSEYTVVEGSTAKDVIDAALLANNMTCENPSGNYIASITKGDVTLGEFTNGKYSGWMYTLNGSYPDLGVSEQEVKNNDQIVLHYTDYYPEEENHVWETAWTFDKNAHWHECANSKNENSWCNISSNERKNGYAAHTYDKGKVTKAATCTTAGVKTYTCTVCGATKTVSIPKTRHTYTWKTTTKATVFKPAVQTKVCSKCGYKTKTTRPYGKKLTPTLKLNATKITLKVNQSTSRVKVTGLANGDAVKAWGTTNKKIVTVSSKGVIKAGKTAGTAKVSVTLKSGKKAYITVTVQKSTVKTTKITGVKSALTLKKGAKTTLKPVRTPFTSGEKITYTSSNKNVATVSSTGVITAKKAGTAVITVKSGSKKVTCKVTVK